MILLIDDISKEPKNFRLGFQRCINNTNWQTKTKGYYVKSHWRKERLAYNLSHYSSFHKHVFFCITFFLALNVTLCLVYELSYQKYHFANIHLSRKTELNKKIINTIRKQACDSQTTKRKKYCIASCLLIRNTVRFNTERTIPVRSQCCSRNYLVVVGLREMGGGWGG